LYVAAQSRAAHTGRASLEAYVTTLIRNDTALTATSIPTFRTTGELESKLVEGLASPTSEMTNADWDELRRALR
jgi:hypothetical protein